MRFGANIGFTRRYAVGNDRSECEEPGSAKTASPFHLRSRASRSVSSTSSEEPRIFRTLFHPERYHGHGKRAPFFEGWYFKLVDPTEQHRFAVIPGIFLSDDPAEEHAFIQVLDGSTGHATYHRFSSEDFSASEDSFDVRIGPNHFTRTSLRLDIADGDRTVSGRVDLVDLTPWPVSFTSLGIMGPYGWVPWMECNHGVVSLDHGLSGALTLAGSERDFTGGRGYVEKDWGKSFPAGYVWIQSNHFEREGVSFVGSIAIIPWVLSSFPGVIVGLWLDGRLFRFATYTGAGTQHLRITDEVIEWVLADNEHVLVIEARRERGGLLYGPTRERMSDRVGETMLSEVYIDLRTKAGGSIFEGTGRNTGLEAHGDLQRLLAMQV